MCSWQQKVFEALKPLRKLLDRELKKGKLLQFDETPLKVLKYSRAGMSIPSTHTISDGLAAERTYFRSSKDLRAM